MANVKLMTCPACGAKLNLKDYAESGKCPYCDTTIKVSPKGIAESVSHVVGSIGNQQRKTMKQDAELKELKAKLEMEQKEKLAELEAKYSKQKNKEDRKNTLFYLILLMLMPLILMLIYKLMGVM